MRPFGLLIGLVPTSCTIADRHFAVAVDASDSDAETTDANEPCKLQVVWLNDDIERDLWIVDLDGTNKRPLTIDAHVEEDPQWSPSGDRLTYSSQGAIWTMNADGTEARAVTTTGFGSRWSPDGRYLAYSNANTIWRVDVETGDSTQLTFIPSTNGVAFSWSPNGERIAFHTDSGTANREVWVMDADGSNPVNLSMNAANDGDPIWSPDGTKILFFSDRGGDTNLWTMDPDGDNEFEIVVATPGEVLLTHQWFPDSFKVLFTRYGTTPMLHFDIVGINANGTGYDPFGTTELFDIHPMISSDSRIVWLSGSALDDTELWITEPNAVNPRLLTTAVGNNQDPQIRPCP